MSEKAQSTRPRTDRAPGKAPDGAADGGGVVRWFFWLSLAAAMVTYAVIVAGAVVRVTGSGLGCPDWPTCHGQLLPPMDTAAIIEWTHRLFGALASPLIVAVPIAALLRRRDRRILIPAVATPLLLVVQVLLGRLVVLLELPPMAVLVHLGFAVLILGGLVWVTVQAAGLPSSRGPVVGGSRHYPVLLAVTAAVVFVLVLSGAYTRATGASWACTSFPGCDVPTAAVQAAEAAGNRGLVEIHIAHRITAYIATVLIVASVAETWRLRQNVPALMRAAVALLAATVAQVTVGALVVQFGLPVPLRGAHVAGAAAVWAASITLMGLAYRTQRLAGASDRDAMPEAAPARGLTRLGEAPRSPADAATQLTSVAQPQGVEAAALQGTDSGTESVALIDRSEAPWRTTVRAFISLTKPKVILLLEVPTLAAMLVASPNWPSPLLVIATLLGGALAAGGAAAINCYLDRDIDALMGDRTTKRAIPAGLVTPGQALAFGLILGVASFFVLFIFANLLAAFLAQVALLFYVFVYTRWLKRTTPSNIVIGGAAGAIPPLVGWAAVTGEVGPVAWLLFAVIFFWTPPHFWALSLLIKQHYERANIPMLPVVKGDDETRRQIMLYAVQMICVTLLFTAFRLSGLFYFGAAIVLGAAFLYLASRLWRHATRSAASQLFHFSILYLWLLCIALVLDKRLFA